VNKQPWIVCLGGAALLAGILACGAPPSLAGAPSPTVLDDAAPVDRESRIPDESVKMSPETDSHPPEVYSQDYQEPVPVLGQVNTAGAEDSPFITPDGSTLYFFFTPDVNVPVQQQVIDSVTGIYVSRRVGDVWQEPDRVVLENPGEASGDGCEFVQGDVMWFCSVREGYTGVHWFTAKYTDGAWGNWKLADFDPKFKVGELHISSDGAELYFGSDRTGGKGGLDIWVSKLVNNAWQEPVDVEAVNTADDEGWPALNPAGNELWFSRNYGIWRSKLVDGAWQEAQLIISPLSGEPSIDQEGNVYFVHHFYVDDRMIEADIYVAAKR
jgi:hypothetical protein